MERGHTDRMLYIVVLSPAVLNLVSTVCVAVPHLASVHYMTEVYTSVCGLNCSTLYS